MQRYVRALGLGLFGLIAITALLAFAANGFSAARVADGNDAVRTDVSPFGERSGLTSEQDPPHDVALEGCASEGSALVNLSDTVGAYVYLHCEAVNLSDHDDQVTITSGGDLVTSTLPSGCVSNGSLVIPGRTDFVLLAGDRMQLLYRIRFECHAPAVEAIVPVTFAIAIEHMLQPDGLDDSNPANNSVTLTEDILIGPPAPTTTPTPTPVPDTDGDGIPDTVDPDDDNDRVFDADEGPCGGDPLDPGIHPERLDSPADDDGDTAVNEPLPSGSGGFDCDGDGWKGNEEMVIYNVATSTSNDQDACGNNGWTADLAGNDNLLNISDIDSFLFPLRVDGSFNKFDHPVPDPDDADVARWNLFPDDKIDIGDLNALNPAVIAPTARPPMFGGQPAFFGDAGNGVGGCPFPP